VASLLGWMPGPPGNNGLIDLQRRGRPARSPDHLCRPQAYIETLRADQASLRRQLDLAAFQLTEQQALAVQLAEQLRATGLAPATLPVLPAGPTSHPIARLDTTSSIGSMELQVKGWCGRGLWDAGC
jgi:hypothetical protein